MAHSAFQCFSSERRLELSPLPSTLRSLQKTKDLAKLYTVNHVDPKLIVWPQGKVISSMLTDRELENFIRHPVIKTTPHHFHIPGFEVLRQKKIRPCVLRDLYKWSKASSSTPGYPVICENINIIAITNTPPNTLLEQIPAKEDVVPSIGRGPEPRRAPWHTKNQARSRASSIDVQARLG